MAARVFGAVTDRSISGTTLFTFSGSTIFTPAEFATVEVDFCEAKPFDPFVPSRLDPEKKAPAEDTIATKAIPTIIRGAYS